MEAVLLIVAALLLVGCIGLTLARERAVRARHEAERELAVTKKELEQSERRGSEFEQLKQEMLQAAQAAVLKPAQDLSTKLLEDHKRETNAAKEDSERRTQKASEDFIKRVEQLSNVVASIESRQSKSDQEIETVMRSLSSPGGAGQMAETVLGNTLQSFAFETPRDYVLQFSTTDSETGQRQKPDAVIFLPGNSVVVIDVKASKFLLEIAAAEGTEKEEEAWRGLAATMNRHVKGLASKDYRTAVVATCRETGRAADLAHVHSLMFLPTEGALEKLHRADPEFLGRARALDIIPVGPGGLHSVLSIAARQIGLMQQAENHQKIIEGACDLVESLGDALNHSLAVGKNLKLAAEAYGKFSGSVNHRLLPRAKKLKKLGIHTNKQLPNNLPDYRVAIHEGPTIDGEAEEIAPPRPRLIGE